MTNWSKLTSASSDQRTETRSLGDVYLDQFLSTGWVDSNSFHDGIHGGTGPEKQHRQHFTFTDNYKEKKTIGT